MLRVFTFILIVSAAPAIAQDNLPDVDASLLDSCIAEHAENPETCISVAADACMEGEGGSSTIGMGQCMGQEQELWDERLNDAYGALMEQAKETDDGYAGEASSPNRAGLLKNMQQDWIAFRDSSCAFAQSEFHGGSMASTVGSQCLLDLTAKQALTLEGHLHADDDR